MSNNKKINSVTNSGNDITSTEQTIILNVGGIKYETRRSTLTAYPDTFLGTMFANRNLSLLHPKNENEYFIDRDGNLFRYVMQYYRTGKIYLPYFNSSDVSTQSSSSQSHFPLVSLEEIEAELDYFQVPFKKPSNPSKLSFSI
ncbi:BTB/POZ protein, partial [Glomus cerebriforme]